MSQAFVKETEEQWLHEIQPTLNALINYLTKENNGIRVYEHKNYINPNPDKPEPNREMSNFPFLWNYLLKDIAKR